MTEDQVIDRAEAHFIQDGWERLYRTSRAVGEGGRGEHGGVDAILHRDTPHRFIFVEGKGASGKKEKLSTNFTNCLGAILKRICVNHGYSSNEGVEFFSGSSDREKRASRDIVRTHGTLENSTYVLALTEEYRIRAKTSIEKGVRDLLHIRILIVDESSVVDIDEGTRDDE